MEATISIFPLRKFKVLVLGGLKKEPSFQMTIFGGCQQLRRILIEHYQNDGIKWKPNGAELGPNFWAAA